MEVNNYRGLMISNRPNQEIKIVENKPFISRVDPKDRLGLNSVKLKQQPLPQKSNQDVLDVLSHHKRWLHQFKQKVQQKKQNSSLKDQEQEQKIYKLRQQSLRNIQANKQRATLLNMNEDLIAPEISPNQAQEILGLDEDEIQNYKKTYDQIQNQNDNQSVGDLGDINEAYQQNGKKRQKINSSSKSKNKSGNLKKKNKKKPEWAMTEKQYNDYQQQKEEEEADDLLDFVNNLDYQNYVDDLEYTQLLGALKTRIEDLTDKNQDKKQQRQKQLRYIEDRENQNQDNQSMASHQSKSSIASIRDEIVQKNKIQEDKDWDKSTVNGGEKVSIEQRLVKHIADEILKNNRYLRNIHSNSSLRTLLENEAQRQLKSQQQKQQKN